MLPEARAATLICTTLVTGLPILLTFTHGRARSEGSPQSILSLQQLH